MWPHSLFQMCFSWSNRSGLLEGSQLMVKSCSRLRGGIRTGRSLSSHLISLGMKLMERLWVRNRLSVKTDLQCCENKRGRSCVCSLKSLGERVRYQYGKYSNTPLLISQWMPLAMLVLSGTPWGPSSTMQGTNLLVPFRGLTFSSKKLSSSSN